LLDAEYQRESRLHLARFYARRARRLLPASALMLLVTLGFGAVVLAPQELTQLGRSARTTALYMSNIYFALNAADYFAPSVKLNPLLHTWSLAVEEQFYFVWPLLIMIGLRLSRSRRALQALLAAVAVASFVLCLWATTHSGTFAFYQSPARAWEFAVGGIVAIAVRDGLGVSAGTWKTVRACGVLVVLCSAATIPDGPGFPGWLAVIPVVGTAAALAAGPALRGDNGGWFLSSRPLQLFGRYSYSWYLWHWPFIAIGMVLFPQIGPLEKTALSVTAFLVAVAAHELVENPIRFHKRLVASAAPSLVMAGVITVCSIGAATVLIAYSRMLANTPAMLAIARAAEAEISRLPRSCVSRPSDSAVLTCDYGASTSNTRVVLFGDSHAMQWFNPLEQLAKANQWRLTTVVKSACPATQVDLPGRTAVDIAACNTWRTAAIERIDALKPSMVVVANGSSYLAVTGKMLPAKGVSTEQWYEGTLQTMQRLKSNGARVVWLRDNPLSKFDVPTCLARSSRHAWYVGNPCVMDRAQVLHPEIFEAEKRAAQQQPSVLLVDMTDQLCDERHCLASRNGESLYHDDNHFTGAFAESLAAVLFERMRAAQIGGKN
jgi:peptidoglycan/LPS O-acetylase OafA/YrhL